MNNFKCPHCRLELSAERREHICKRTRSAHGKMVDSLVVYQPNYPKLNKQATRPGYMKRFGSRPSSKTKALYIVNYPRMAGKVSGAAFSVKA